MAALREHPLDNIYTRKTENVPALILGVSNGDNCWLRIFFVAEGGYSFQCNITLAPLGYILGSPRLHHWNHDIHRNGSCNLANLSPLMDILFGTYYAPGKELYTYGIK